MGQHDLFGPLLPSHLHQSLQHLVWLGTDHGPARGSRPSLAARYTYDAWYRVVEAENGPVDAPDEIEALTYDLIDCVTSRSSTRTGSAAHVGDYVYHPGQPNAVTQAGDKTFAYDPAGFMVDHDGAALEWDHRGRLLAYARGDKVARFGYGPDEERLMRVDEGTSYYISDDFEVLRVVARGRELETTA